MVSKAADTPSSKESPCLCPFIFARIELAKESEPSKIPIVAPVEPYQMIHNRSCHVLCIIAILLVSVLGGNVEVLARNKAIIVNTKIVNEDPALKVSFAIENCFTREMEEAVWSGVVTTFRFLALLERPGLPLVRERMVDVTFEHSIRYDRIRNEFTVFLQEQTQRVRTTYDFQEAKQWMSEIRSLPLVPLWRLQVGEQYQLRLKAELSKVQLPPFLRYIFFWAALWDFETGWHQETFTFDEAS
jgi:hypothetical protein